MVGPRVDSPVTLTTTARAVVKPSGGGSGGGDRARALGLAGDSACVVAKPGENDGIPFAGISRADGLSGVAGAAATGTCAEDVDTGPDLSSLSSSDSASGAGLRGRGATAR